MISGLIREMRRRGVFGTAAIYVVASWVLIQVASEALPAFNIPEFAIRFVWMGVILGLPLAVTVGWLYDVSSQGVHRTAPADCPEANARSLQKGDYALLSAITLIALSIASLLFFQIARLSTPPGEPLLTQTIEPNSIAVLPLDNFTGDPEQDYFVAGLHEALTASLTGIQALKVISRTSASAFAGSKKTLPEIGEILGAANIIEGSVFRSGNRVRITVQLIDARNDKHLWAENFERELVDLMSLHGEVTQAIARQIRVTLTPEEQLRLDTRRSVDPEVYSLYLKGMYFLKQYTPEGIQKGLPYLHQAIASDPANARAHAGLALGYNLIGHGIGRDAFPKALAAAQRALSLDEHSGEAWAALAEAQLYHSYDWAESYRSFRRAIQLAPSLDEAHAHFAYLLILLGDWETAFYHSDKARELNPLDPTWAYFTAWLHTVRGQLDEAEKLLLESLQIRPGFPLSLWTLGDIHRFRGQIDEAIEIQESIPEGNPIRNWALGPTYAMAGRTDDARAIVAAMSVDPGPKDRLFIASTHATLGEYDRAMDWLEDCYELRVDWLPWIAVDQGYSGVLEGLRAHPRFQDLIRKLNIPENKPPDA